MNELNLENHDGGNDISNEYATIERTNKRAKPKMLFA